VKRDKAARFSVVVADDHAPMRRLLCEELSQRGFEVLGEAASAREAIAVALAAKPDLCLLDINMPGGGLDAASALSHALPDTSVVMITAVPREDQAEAAARAGARGYVAKGADPDELPEVLRVVATGGAGFASPWLECLHSAGSSA